MIWLAAFIEGFIQDWVDMSILLVIQFINASIGYYEITNASDAVAALKKSLKVSILLTSLHLSFMDGGGLNAISLSPFSTTSQPCRVKLTLSVTVYSKRLNKLSLYRVILCHSLLGVQYLRIVD
jgi:hypothetical protein